MRLLLTRLSAHVTPAPSWGAGALWSRCAPRPWCLAIVFAFALVGVSPSEAHAESASQAAERVLGSDGYQRTLPGPGDTTKRGQSTQRRSGSWGRRRRRAAEMGRAGAGLAVLLELVFWAVLAIVVVGVVFWLVRELQLRRAAPPTALDVSAVAKPPGTGEDAVDETVLRDAEALAASGLFGEAVHALLLRAIEVLKTVRTVPDSLTSRELVRLVGLVGGRQTAFFEILTTAERAHFGGRIMGADDFSACASAYRAFMERAA